MNMRAEISDDTLHLTFSQRGDAQDAQKRPLQVLGVFSAQGDLIGLDIPKIGQYHVADTASNDSGAARSPSEIDAAKEEFAKWLSGRKPLASPEAKPFDPDKVRIDLPEEEWEAFHKVLESFREPEPWTNPWG